ncbi:hypothetical protein NPX13_g1692 [Xylaria arbuscula]|uniref:Uncharacterized protein n=1 Tax=Xylaria arbuscula TaxID=114810 RepID=A0A9W8NKJ4_9PEZI|nr:hypothetical protein NPX13_g1692 [Xylaria arbuscula]
MRVEVKPELDFGEIKVHSTFISVPPTPSETRKLSTEYEDAQLKEAHKRTLLWEIMPRPKSDRERLKARQSRINRLIDLIEQIRHGKYLEKGEMIQRQLFPRDYTELLLKLEERGPDLLYLFHHELQYEYRESIRGKAQFTIIFRQQFRKSIAISITCKVDRWIQNLVEDPNSSADCRRVAGKIMSMHGMRLTFASKTLCSDSDFLYDEEYCENPSVVFEIAWSQSTAGLEKKAIEIIEEGDGEIRTVVGLDFSKTYGVWDTLRDEIGSNSSPKRGPCTAFVWRAAFDKNGQLLFEHGRPMLHRNTYVFFDGDGMAVFDQKRDICICGTSYQYKS